MRRLDDLCWGAGLSLISYGLRIGVRAQKGEMLEHLRDLLPPGCTTARSTSVDRLYSVCVEDRAVVVYADARRIARTPDQALALGLLESDLHLHVAQHAHDRIFVHAGAVAFNGRAIVIPGRSMTGKSTLVAALVRAGASYYSDEYAVVDALGRVHSYPRLLSLRRGSGEPPRRCRPEEFGGKAGVRPLRVGLIVVSRYHAGHTWAPKRMPAGQAVLALCKNTVAARSRTDEAISSLVRLATGSLALRGTRGDADDTAARILATSLTVPRGVV